MFANSQTLPEEPVSENFPNYIEIASDIVSAYIAKNSVSATDLPDIIVSVYASLKNLGSEPAIPAAAPLVPAVPIRKSVTPDAIICLEDGKPFKALKRHLNTSFGLSPAQYRAKWGLPADYPMVAPAYSEVRSAMAKAIGLGRKPKELPAPAKS